MIGRATTVDATPAVAAAETPAAEDGIALPSTRGLLLRLRAVAVAGQVIAIAVAQGLGVGLPLVPMGMIVGGSLAISAWSWLRSRRGAPVTLTEVVVLLAFDLAAFSLLLALAGGIANPFWSLYVLHVVLIALLLPRRLAFAGALVVVATFAIAFAFSAPLRYDDGRPVPDTVLAVGLGVGFALTALVTAWFVVRIVADLRAHERLLREAARRALNDEAIMRLGALAAGAAHELATPLTTMAVVAGEMAREVQAPAVQRDAAILTGQIEACRRALSNLTAAAGHLRAEGGGPERLDALLASLVTRFQAVRPNIPLDARWDGTAPVPEIFADASLPAILILLNNAADASPHHVDFTGHWDADMLRLAVGDRGTGVPPSRLGELGRAFFTTKPPGKGTGLGLVLTASTVSRLGGSVRWTNRPEGGLAAEITLPLAGLRVRT